MTIPSFSTVSFVSIVIMGLTKFSSLTMLALTVSAASWSATPFNPASVPLAVRSPYLSAWLPQGAGTALNGAWPQFWTGSTLGWAGYIRVDGATYTFLGDPVVAGAESAVQKSLEFTSTQSIFVMTAGPVDINVNFLSPVETSLSSPSHSRIWHFLQCLTMEGCIPSAYTPT